ncbi:ash family protein [Pseudomonas putida]|nr:ash family protein [Pseudomonas putida]
MLIVLSSRALQRQSCPCHRTGTTEGTTLEKPRTPVAIHGQTGYLFVVAANSATGRRNPNSRRRIGAPFQSQALFLCPRYLVMAAVRGQTSVWPGPFLPGIPTPRIAATQSRRKDSGSSSNQEGATSMFARLFSLTTPEIQSKIELHRARAVAQLKSKSSLKVRHERYNSEMARARFFESLLVGGAQ